MVVLFAETVESTSLCLSFSILLECCIFYSAYSSVHRCGVKIIDFCKVVPHSCQYIVILLSLSCIVSTLWHYNTKQFNEPIQDFPKHEILAKQKCGK